MNPKIWGPHFWFVLHIITFNYPKNPTAHDKQAYRDFFTSIKDILPCYNCKKHYAKNINKYPITPNLDNKKQLVTWLINIHNQVNKDLGKETYTLKEVLEIYKNLNPINPFTNSKCFTDSVTENQKGKNIEGFKTNTQSKLKSKCKNLKLQFNKINNKVLYFIIIILIIIVIYLKIQYKKNYYDL